MTRVPLFQVDAFAPGPFTGNPAAVVVLAQWPDDATLLAVAAENNLSETAFIVPDGDAWALRWFTPATEVDLCGHATLAAGFVVGERLRPGTDRVAFDSRAGRLTVWREGEAWCLDMPADPPAPVTPPDGLAPALGVPAHAIEAVRAGRFLMVALPDAGAVRALAPDFAALAALDTAAVLPTAPGDGVDFVSRCFAPGLGIPEDPVTGSAHAVLVPYWAARLGRTRLEAHQLSARGGRLACRLDGDRVVAGGPATLYLEGMITLEAQP